MASAVLAARVAPAAEEWAAEVQPLDAPTAERWEEQAPAAAKEVACEVSEAGKFDDRSTDPGDRSTDTFSDQACSDDEHEDVLANSHSSGAPPLDSLIIFDWDDTLFPTSWLARYGGLFEEISDLPEEQQTAMSALAGAVSDTISEAMVHGRVVIITNGVEGWVQDSCIRLMPSLAPLLSQIQIVSARSNFEPLGVRCPTDWKVMAFQAQVAAFCDALGEPSQQQQRNVISIGDSVHEHCALLQATSDRDQCFAKSMKFGERPSMGQLIEEHRLVSGSIAEVVGFEGDLDVDVGGSSLLDAESIGEAVILD